MPGCLFMSCIGFITVTQLIRNQNKQHFYHILSIFHSVLANTRDKALKSQSQKKLIYLRLILI